jgi:hypothetical protein
LPTGIFQAASPHRPMKFNPEGGIVMALVIFVGGMFLGFSLGFAAMAMLAARDHQSQREEVQVMGGNLACAYSPIHKFRLVRRAIPRVFGVLLTPRP